MKEVMIIKSLFIFFIFWGIGITLLWIRPRIEIFWKIAATVLYALHLWFFFEEAAEGYRLFVSAWYPYAVNFLREFLVLVFVNMFFFWPLALIMIFFKADDMGAERLVKFLCVLSLCLWIIFIVYAMFTKGIDSFFIDSFRQMIPGAK